MSHKENLIALWNKWIKEERPVHVLDYEIFLSNKEKEFENQEIHLIYIKHQSIIINSTTFQDVFTINFKRLTSGLTKEEYDKMYKQAAELGNKQQQEKTLREFKADVEILEQFLYDKK